MRLAGAGREVTLLEAGRAGGRAGLLELAAPDGAGTYRIDPGPTVLTMPDLIADCFDALGERMEDWLELLRSSRRTGPILPTGRGSTCTPTPTPWPRRSRP